MNAVKLWLLYAVSPREFIVIFFSGVIQGNEIPLELFKIRWNPYSVLHSSLIRRLNRKESHMKRAQLTRKTFQYKSLKTRI